MKYSDTIIVWCKSPETSSPRLLMQDTVMNSDFRAYVCINNGSSGINTTGKGQKMNHFSLI